MGLSDDFGLNQPKARGKHEDVTIRESAVSVMLALLSLGLGIAYLVGGAKRFNSPALDAARQIAPWYCWSILFIGYSLVLLVTLHRISHWAFLFFGAFFYAVLAVGCYFSIGKTDTGSYTLPWLFTWFFIVHVDVSYRRHNSSIRRTSPLPD